MIFFYKSYLVCVENDNTLAGVCMFFQCVQTKLAQPITIGLTVSASEWLSICISPVIEHPISTEIDPPPHLSTPSPPFTNGAQ